MPHHGTKKLNPSCFLLFVRSRSSFCVALHNRTQPLHRILVSPNPTSQSRAILAAGSFSSPEPNMLLQPHCWRFLDHTHTRTHARTYTRTRTRTHTHTRTHAHSHAHARTPHTYTHAHTNTRTRAHAHHTHTINTRNEHPCPQTDSYPRPQQSSCLRPTTYNARAPGSGHRTIGLGQRFPKCFCLRTPFRLRKVTTDPQNLLTYTQGVSEGIVNILEGGSMEYSE